MKILIYTIPKIAWQLAGGSLIRFKIILLKLWYFAITRKLQLFKNDFTLTGVCYMQPITFYLRYVMDVAVLREVFVDKEYDWFPIENPKVIIDLGAHFGDTTLYYAARFPDAKIIAVEPSPENFARLVQHTKNFPNIIPVQAAVGGEDGTILLHLMPSSLGHSVVDRKGSGETILVPQYTLMTLFAKFDVQKADLIKFDIEGAEFDLFKSITPSEMASAFIGEVHYDLAEDKSINFESYFSNFKVEKTQLQNENRFLIRVSK